GSKIVTGVEDASVFGTDGLRAVGGIVFAATSAFEMSQHADAECSIAERSVRRDRGRIFYPWPVDELLDVESCVMVLGLASSFAAMADLKPRMLSPSPLPSSGSFLGPNTIRAI